MARKSKNPEELSQSIRRAIATADASVDSSKLLHDIIEEWGGTKNLAKDIRSAFKAAPKGSMIRQRFLEMIQRLIITNTAHDLTKQINPAELSDEDLEILATHFARKALLEEQSHGVAEGEAERQESDPGVGSADLDAESRLEPIEREESFDQ